MSQSAALAASAYVSEKRRTRFALEPACMSEEVAVIGEIGVRFRSNNRSWSNKLSARGTGSASVLGTSECRSPATVVKTCESDVATMALSLRRHYPVRFERSVALRPDGQPPSQPGRSELPCGSNRDVTVRG